MCVLTVTDNLSLVWFFDLELNQSFRNFLYGVEKTRVFHSFNYNKILFD